MLISIIRVSLVDDGIFSRAHAKSLTKLTEVLSLLGKVKTKNDRAIERHPCVGNAEIA